MCFVASFAGPLSWPLAVLVLLFLGQFVPRNVDSGWVQMDMGFKALGVIALVHVLGFVATAVFWIQLNRSGRPKGKVLKFGALYYGLLIAGFIITMGPLELLNDGFLLVRHLFGG